MGWVGSAEDRTENIRRVGEVAKLVAESGVMALTSFISPYREDRDAVRERVGSGSFLEVFLAVPIELCEERDPKGLYKKARAGQIQNFTGVDDPYEAPQKPEITLTPYRADGTMHTPEEMAAKVIGFLEDAGYIARPSARKGSHLSQPVVA
ncbi:adenylylsulfate kinase [Helicosporidium sp. ATCC 50920]|nr:adenylylsulfate kinase [Helicosporidium sp. ATCC 50920]|eukprot:KDD76745.1 adenylylsulfate kinase [Helicosporidium sp. ATCC 50920]